MYSAVKLHVPSRPSNRLSGYRFRGAAIPARRLFVLRHLRRLSTLPSLSVHSGYNGVAAVEESEPSVSSEHYTTSVGSPSGALQLSQWNLTQRHIHLLTAVACAVAVSATWLFISAIPTLLAFRRAAESLEKLMDATREELPDTMAAVRLSGMEISDLAMELSDLGQEITQGVRSSTRAVRSAEERLRQFTTMSPPAASVQGLINPETEGVKGGPVVAVTARNMREGIVKGRSMVQILFSLIGFSRAAFGFLASRQRNK